MSEPAVEEAALDETAPMPAEIPADLSRIVRGMVSAAARDETPPPLVRARPATAGETPAEAAKAARVAAERGLDVLVTFAQGGTWRTWRERGVCPTCGATPMLLAEAKRSEESTDVLQPHNRPGVGRCPGSGRPAAFGRLCEGCDQVPKRINKNGTVPPHDLPLVPCLDQSAREILPAQPRPPICSIAVRVARLAVACWYVDIKGDPPVATGKFDIGFTWDGTYLAKVDAAGFQRVCREGVPVG